MNRMAMIVYNEAVDDDVMGALEHCALKNYTKILGTYGSGNASGTHLGNDIWPGRNNIIYVACEEEEADQLLARVRELRHTLGKEGIKAFLLPLEEAT